MDIQKRISLANGPNQPQAKVICVHLKGEFSARSLIPFAKMGTTSEALIITYMVRLWLPA